MTAAGMVPGVTVPPPPPGAPGPHVALADMRQAAAIHAAEILARFYEMRGYTVVTSMRPDCSVPGTTTVHLRIHPPAGRGGWAITPITVVAHTPHHVCQPEGWPPPEAFT